MTTIYICNSMEDIAAFIKMFPKSCWSDQSPLNIDSSNLRKSLPIALHKTPNTDTVSWTAVHNAAYHLQSNPQSYKLGVLQPLLDLATVFVTFLKHHNAYDEFITQDFQYTKNIQFSQLLIDTFDWEESSEGYGYWDNIDDKWRDLVNDFKLNRNEVIPNLLDILH